MLNTDRGKKKHGPGYLLISVIMAVLSGAYLVDSSFSAGAKNGTQGVKLIEAITNPSYDGMLSFPVAGRILNVPVKVGQRVKKGDLLVQLDDRVELTRLEQLKKESTNDVRVKAAKAQQAQKELELKRVKTLQQKHAATDTELEQAILDYEINGYSVELAEFELAQAGLKYEEMRQQIQRMKIVAPCDGVIEELKVENGESVQQAQDVVRLVEINPLWVDIPVPLKIANTLKLGDTVKIYFDETLKEKDSGEGKVIQVAVVADAAVDTRMVRVEISNSQSRPAGMRVWAKISENTDVK